jgi:hypothetical protein
MADDWLRAHVKSDSSTTFADPKRMFAEVCRYGLAEQEVRVRNSELALSTYDQYRLMLQKHLIPSIGRRELGALGAKTLNEEALSPRKALPGSSSVVRAKFRVHFADLDHPRRTACRHRSPTAT